MNVRSERLQVLEVGVGGWMRLPGEEDGNIVVVRVSLVARVDQLLPLTEAPEGVVRVVTDIQSLTKREREIASCY